MAPPKAIQKGTTLMPLARKGISTRSKNITNDQNADITGKKGIGTMIGKRKADASPIKNDRVKRSALGNLTNAVINCNTDADSVAAKGGLAGAIVKKKQQPINSQLKKTASTTTIGSNSSVIVKACSTNAVAGGILKISTLGEFQIPKSIGIGQVPTARPTKVMTRAALRATSTTATAKNNQQTGEVFESTAIKAKEITEAAAAKLTTRRISNDFEKTEDSLYVSALEEMSSSDSLRLSLNSRRSSVISLVSTDSDKSLRSIAEDDSSCTDIVSSTRPPPGVTDFDKENWDDPFQVSHYTMDIFNYLKSRESEFEIDNYMERQVHLTKWMRMLLVDWMVEVQETFELNHETLYLAVKIVDIYLGKTLVIRDKLQLLGAAALFLACKYDERTPPLIDDFLYICDKAYNQTELIRMEMDLFKVIGLDLGMPLSYRFLRRYARCARVAMPILTLARYVLEMALMDYATIRLSDSKLACAALFIALRMNNLPGWDTTLEYYSGYKLKDFETIVPILNVGLHQRPRDQIKTVRNKYSHKIFFEVAKIKLLSAEELFEQLDLENTSSPVSVSRIGDSCRGIEHNSRKH